MLYTNIQLLIIVYIPFPYEQRLNNKYLTKMVCIYELLSLPTELIIDIILLLPVHDIVKLSGVNKQLYNIIQDNYIWYKIMQNIKHNIPLYCANINYRAIYKYIPTFKGECNRGTPSNVLKKILGTDFIISTNI